MATYTLGSSTHEITPVKLVIAVLIVGFAVLELTPRFEKMAFNPKYIPLGGVLSGILRRAVRASRGIAHRVPDPPSGRGWSRR